MLGKLFIVVFVTILSISSAYSQSRDSIILNKIIYVSKAYIAKNNTDSALKYLTLGKNYFKQSPKALATLLDEEGKVYFSTGNAIKAGSICYEALKIYEELKDSVYISKCYNRLAALNVTQGNANKAVDFFKKAILYNNFKDTSNTFSTYSNMGYMYMNQEKNDSALFYFKKAMPYALTKEHIITIINNIEGTFINLNNIDSAKKYTALREKYLVKNVQEVIMNHEVKGVTFYKQKNYSEAKKQFKAAFDIAKANKKLHSNVEIIQSLSVIYGHLQNTDSAYYYLLKYNAIKDSVYGSENNRKLVELQINHNFEKKRAVELAKQEQQELFYKEKIKRKEITSILLGIAFILAFIILILSYFAYIRKKRVNELLEHKKNIIEQKNTLILDSINYAQQLQESMLTNSSVLNSYFKNHYLLYKAKDIVSGDFYWFYPIYQSSNGKEEPEQIIIAVADCTGHGVPGAFMSILGIYSIEYVITELISSLLPNSILDRLNMTFSQKLNKKNRDEIKDSMDLVMASYDKASKKLSYAGAKGSFILVRNKAAVEYKTDNVSLGKKTDYEYQNFELQLKENDQLYFYSDGLHTQKGGPENRKMNATVFKQLLLEISEFPFHEQEKQLNKKIEQWIGNSEQFDDILILALHV